jgi:hypothetical protein
MNKLTPCPICGKQPRRIEWRGITLRCDGHVQIGTGSWKSIQESERVWDEQVSALNPQPTEGEVSPCPICHQPPIVDISPDFCYVLCVGLHTSEFLFGGAMGKTEEEAVFLWNEAIQRIKENGESC